MSEVAALRAFVVTVSDRSYRGEREDSTGPKIVEALEGAGYTCESTIVPDGVDTVEAALRDGISRGAAVIVTTGGTGLSPRDHTPEATRAVVEVETPGIIQTLIARGLESTPLAGLSRGIAGVTRAALGENGYATFIVNLPGSRGGVADGMETLVPLLPHIHQQLAGCDH